MTDLLFLAYRHSLDIGWITHMVVSSIVHGLIYGLMFKVMHQLTLVQAAVLVALVIGGLIMWSRSRDRRGW